MGPNIMPANTVDVLSFSAGPHKGHLFITVSLTFWVIHRSVQPCARVQRWDLPEGQQQTAACLHTSLKQQNKAETADCAVDSWAQWYIFGQKMWSLRRCSAGSISQFRVLLLSRMEMYSILSLFFKPVLSLSLWILWNYFKVANLNCFGNLCKH